MSILKNEADDPSLEKETVAASPAPAWNRPWLLAGLGLVLMLIGYAAVNYVPVTPRQAEQEHRLAQLRDQATRQRTEGTTAALEERLKQVDPPWRTPPYQLPGRLAIFAGLFLFLAAGFLMYRQSPAARSDPE